MLFQFTKEVSVSIHKGEFFCFNSQRKVNKNHGVIFLIVTNLKVHFTALGYTKCKRAAKSIAKGPTTETGTVIFVGNEKSLKKL
jgi:hypothetical protein